jgi:predicted nucleotidyltransferase
MLGRVPNVSDGSDARTALSVLVAAALDGRLDALCEPLGVALMSAFGSATHQSLHEPRDLDIGVSFRRHGQVALVSAPRLALWTALVDLTGYEGIDVVVIDGDNPVLRAEALNGVALYEHHCDQFAEARIAAVGEQRDTAHLRRRNLELMAK